MNFDYSQLPRHNILFCDMKSFFASVEAVERGYDPLKVLLCVVADTTRSGSVVLASSPAMKAKFGIKSGSRLYEVPKIRGIHIVEARMSLYLKRSIEITRILSRYAPWDSIWQYSIDEAMVYLGNSERLFGKPRDIAEKIQKTIYNEMGLISCFGIGPSRIIAKNILDNLGKKQGIAECDYEDVPRLLWPLPVENSFGIGEGMKKKLNAMDIYAIGDLAKSSLELLRSKFGVIGEEAWWNANGIDFSSPTYDQSFMKQKGIAKGITLLKDYYDIEEIKSCILDLCEDVAKRARDQRVAARTISLGIGYSQHEGGGGFNRSKTMDSATNITMKLYHTCLSLLHKYYNGAIVRSIHVSLSQLEMDDHLQMSLFENEDKQRKIGYVMDEIRNRFGPTAILRGRSYTKGAITIARSNVIGGHKS
jgi:DNA polymerase V